ncbi:hypothetical protein T484DRAFT_1863721 [Baffinella frigidus]|nr:hypothetical protein T484DRAFT_1863721 [Cryptophyta sp. CCMP2293]
MEEGGPKETAANPNIKAYASCPDHAWEEALTCSTVQGCAEGATQDAASSLFPALFPDMAATPSPGKEAARSLLLLMAPTPSPGEDVASPSTGGDAAAGTPSQLPPSATSTSDDAPSGEGLAWKDVWFSG